MRKQIVKATQDTKAILMLLKRDTSLTDDKIAQIINVNRHSATNLQQLVHSMKDAVAKSSFPKGMQPKTQRGASSIGRIGNYLPYGHQMISLFNYGYKPFGNEVLDFNPDTGEFIRFSIQEWRSQEYYRYVGSNSNSLPGLLSYVPMGLELEMVYRNAYNSEQCDSCYEYDEGEGQSQISYCNDDDYCYRGGASDQDKIKAYNFLAELNVAFGAYGTNEKAVWLAKADSSVDVEFVSMPMTLRAYKAGLNIAEGVFKSFTKLSNIAKGFYGPCGGHIHLDKNVFNNTYQYYSFLAMHYDNPEFIASIAQRPVDENSSWCYLHKPNDFARVAKYKLRSSHRGAVNVLDNTIELRYFRSNLKVERLLKNLEHCQAMFHFTGAMTYQDLAKHKSHQLKYYLLWIKAYRYTYKNLFNFLILKKWIKDEQPIGNVYQMVYEDNWNNMDDLSSNEIIDANQFLQEFTDNLSNGRYF